MKKTSYDCPRRNGSRRLRVHRARRSGEAVRCWRWRSCGIADRVGPRWQWQRPVLDDRWYRPQRIALLYWYRQRAGARPKRGPVRTGPTSVFTASSMLPNDVMDLIARSLGKMGYQNVHASNLTPAPFGNATGFRFDLDVRQPRDRTGVQGNGAGGSTTGRKAGSSAVPGAVGVLFRP